MPHVISKENVHWSNFCREKERDTDNNNNNNTEMGMRRLDGEVNNQ